MQIREAQFSDVPQIVDIYSYYVLNTPFTFETEVPTIESYEARMRDVKKNFPFFVLEDSEGAVAAFSYAHFYHERTAFRWTVETSIYVRNGLQGRGLARRLYAPLLSALKDMGAVNVYATLGCPNPYSARFHEKLGFQKIATLPKSGYKFGDWHDVEYYQIVLNPLCSNPREMTPFPRLDSAKYLSGECAEYAAEL